MPPPALRRTGKDSPHMIEKPQKIWFVSSARRGIDVNVARDEPSHIHIARPSRLLRPENSGSSVEPTDEVRDLAVAEVTVQAA
jgi:hypothetical protein